MVVDHCDNQLIVENINATSADRTMCESVTRSPGLQYTLNVQDVPLEVGGQSNPGANYPGNIMGGFNGCVRNVMQNGIVSEFCLVFNLFLLGDSMAC